MNKSFVSKDDILEGTYTSRPIKVPIVIIGYFSDLIKQIANNKVQTYIISNDPEHSSDHKDPSDTAFVHNPT